MDRKKVLLRARIELIENHDSTLFGTVFYDEAECDGMCLVEDIKIELGIK